ncbi:MAG: penicillin-binding protein 2 [Verrucomicrobiota bacterium]
MMPQRQRAIYVFVFLAFGFTLVSMRLVNIMLTQHEKFVAEATKNHWRSVELPARRGSIVDANGIELAQSYLLHDVRLDGEILEKPERNLPRVAALLDLPVSDLYAKFDPEDRYLLLKKDVDDDTVEALKALELRALIFEPNYKRAYPNGGLASQLIGFMSHEDKGVLGIEKLMEAQLRGRAGKRLYEKDGRRREIAAFRRRDVPPVDGGEVMLTIDLGIQHAVEEELDRLVVEFQPERIYAVCVRPQTGEILAMASRPSFNPSQRDTIKPALMKNFCVTDSLEPGSIFKIVPIAGALNDGIVTRHTPIYCENGRFFFAGHYLHDSHPIEVATVEEVMHESSNIGIGKITLNHGEERFNYYLRAFGFGEKTNFLAGQGESAGIVRPVDTWARIDVTRIPIGQGVSATPLQLAMSMAVIANGGKLMQPMLVKQIRDAEGNVVKRGLPKMVRRVIKPETARIVAEMLEGVIEEGTGTKARVIGFPAAGKTGTAQKAENGVYADGKYVASFSGFVPVEDPQFVLLIMVDDPKGDVYYGGSVAGPAFSNISRKITQCLGLVPANQPRVVPGGEVPVAVQHNPNQEPRHETY